MEITLCKHAREVSLTLKSVLTFAFWVLAREEDAVCSGCFCGTTKRRSCMGRNLTSQMQSDRINCARVNQSSQTQSVFCRRMRQSNLSWRELSTFPISCLSWHQSLFWQPENGYFLKFPADFQWNVSECFLHFTNLFHHQVTSGWNSFETFHHKLFQVVCFFILFLSNIFVALAFLGSEVLTDNLLDVVRL